MRTESLRELASFFVRFLRKGGAIVYAAAAPCVLRPASRGAGVRSAAAPGAPQVCGQPRARGAVFAGSGRRGGMLRSRGRLHSAIAVGAPRSAAGEQPLLQRQLELWACAFEKAGFRRRYVSLRAMASFADR